MLRILIGLFVIGALMSGVVGAELSDEVIKQDRKQIEGSWRVTSLVINGNRSKDEDAKKITVVNGDDGSWSVYVASKEVSRGTSTFNPTKKPKAIDFTPTSGGGAGDQFLGIYELGEKTRKLCFAPAGQDRPATFSSTPGSQHILVAFERIQPK